LSLIYPLSITSGIGFLLGGELALNVPSAYLVKYLRFLSLFLLGEFL
jgi:hypothetical protein